MNQRHAVVVAVAVLLTVGLYALFVTSQANRFAREVALAFQAGDLERARAQLEGWAAGTGDGIDRTAIMSLHMAVTIAQVIRDAQLLVEYQGLDLMLSDPEGIAGVPSAFGPTIEGLTAQLRHDQEQMLETAIKYYADHYKGGLRIQSPVSGFLDLLAGEEETHAAYRALIAGDATEHDKAAFHAGVAREALGAVLRVVIEQPEGQSPDEVALGGFLDFAELWWLIAAHSTDVQFAETALGIVLAETEAKPDHPARARAEAALREVRRFG